MRLIDADEFAKDIYKCVMYGNTALIDKYEVLHRLNNAPTIDAEPVRHGHWDIIYTDNIPYAYRCSLCGTTRIDKVYYCPHCGAKMDEVNDETD